MISTLDQVLLETFAPSSHLKVWGVAALVLAAILIATVAAMLGVGAVGGLFVGLVLLLTMGVCAFCVWASQRSRTVRILVDGSDEAETRGLLAENRHGIPRNDSA